MAVAFDDHRAGLSDRAPCTGRWLLLLLVQCAARYNNFVAIDHTLGPWTEEDDLKLFRTVAAVGSKWAHIARTVVPGR